MPKKTKKEKLLAKYHKKLRLLENKQQITAVTQTKNLVSNPTVQTFKKSVEPTNVGPVNKYFYSDMKKSLILILLIIGVEIGLYFGHFIK